MLQRACLLLGLLAATVVLTGCTPAVQSDEVTTDVGAWSGEDVVEVEVSPNVTTPRRRRVSANMTAPLPQRRAAPRVESPREKTSRLETQLQRLQKELARVQEELARLRKQRK